MPGEFAGKVVVVAGGSRGIGRSIAAAFAREGAQTVLAASSPDNLAAAAAAIARTNALRPDTCAGDLRTLAACEAVHARVQEKFGRCDVLVNSAGRLGCLDPPVPLRFAPSPVCAMKPAMTRWNGTLS